MDDVAAAGISAQLDLKLLAQRRDLNFTKIPRSISGSKFMQLQMLGLYAGEAQRGVARDCGGYEVTCGSYAGCTKNSTSPIYVASFPPGNAFGCLSFSQRL